MLLCDYIPFSTPDLGVLDGIPCAEYWYAVR